MCSIFGIGFYQGHNLNSETMVTGLVSRLFREAEVGGRRASGLSIMRERTAHVLRRAQPASELVRDDDYLDFMEDHLSDMDDPNKSNKVMSIIGHCRLNTQGSPSNNLNNHPQVIGDIIGIHNGHIRNNHELFDAFGKVITRKAEVDTEIIFQLINHFSKPSLAKTIAAIQKSTPYLQGGYACGMQNAKHPYNLYLFRHSNPVRIRYYPKLGAVIFATREHFIDKSLEDFIDSPGNFEEIVLIENRGVVFNLWNRTMCKFSFKDSAWAEKQKRGEINAG